MAQDIKCQLNNLRKELHEWCKKTDDMMLELEELANNLDNHFSNITTAKVSGGTMAVAGGLVSAAGFGLSFFTFGASLSLVVAGGLISGTGGLVVSGSQITDAVLSKNRAGTAETIIHTYRSRFELMVKACAKIGKSLKDLGDVDANFPSWVSFWETIVMKLVDGSKNITWDMIKSILDRYIILAVKADQAVLVGGKVATTAFQTIGTATGKGLHVAGGVMGIVLLPFDIGTLVYSSKDFLNGSPHETSEEIRKIADEIKKRRPTKENIDNMVNETVSKIDSLT